MKIRNLISCALCGLTLFACSPSGGGKDREMDRFITDLMDRMTLREKLGQLNSSKKCSTRESLVSPIESLGCVIRLSMTSA